MLMNENFIRCPKCEEGWFKEQKIVLLGKDSVDQHPTFDAVRYVYICTNCNKTYPGITRKDV